MTWNQWIKSGAVGLVVFLVLDGVWLGSLARDFYRIRIEAVAPMQVFWPAAMGFYGLHIVGLLFFVVGPAVQSGAGWGLVLLRGALFGLFTYATYDLTNWATLKGWSGLLALTDIVWGAALNAVTALAAAAACARAVP